MSKEICKQLIQHGECRIPFDWGRWRLGERWGFDGKKELYVSVSEFTGSIDGIEVNGHVELLPNRDFLIRRVTPN